MTKVDLEKLFLLIGEFGLYQKQIFILLGLPSALTALQMLCWVFLTPKIHQRCILPSEHNLTENQLNYTLPFEVISGSYPMNNKTGRHSECKIYNADHEEVTCNRYVYNTSNHYSSVLITWDLVCQDEWIGALPISLFMGGVLVGSFTFGFLSDMIGRRKTFCLASAMHLVFGISSALTNNITMFIILRFLVGMSCPGMFIVAYCLVIEMVGCRKRMQISTYMMMFFALGYLLIPALAALFQGWRSLLLAIALIGTVFLPYWWLIPESPRWLLSKRRIKDAELVLRKICKSNKTELPEDWIQLGRTSSEKGPDLAQGHNQSILSLMKSSRLRTRTINVSFNWFVNSIVYYGLSLNTANLGGSSYFNSLLSAAVEFPAYMLILILIDRMGRKRLLCLCMLTSGACLLITAVFLGGRTWARITFSMIGKLAISSSFGIIYVYTAEMFPTAFRSIALGSGSVSARVGGILAPYINLLSSTWINPLLVFGILSMMAGLLALTLPETKGKRLPETVEEAEKIGS